MFKCNRNMETVNITMAMFLAFLIFSNWADPEIGLGYQSLGLMDSKAGLHLQLKETPIKG